MRQTTILLCTLFFFLTTNLLAQKKQLEKLDFFIGEWKIETRGIQPDGTFNVGKAKSIVKYILDGYTIQDDYLMLDADDKVTFRGTSIRSFNNSTGKYQIVWIMPGVKGLTDISAQFVDNRLVGNGKGYDGNGQFLERFEYYDISKDSYSFKIDRSYDTGKNWIINFGTFKANRIQKGN